MMYSTAFLLFLAAMGGGVLPLVVHRYQGRLLSAMLAFSGGYLLSITLMHILPELLVPYRPVLGIALVGGFFLQLFLEIFSQGIEHGHLCPALTHAHGAGATARGGVLLSTLCLHALLDGVVLTQPEALMHHGSHHHSLLVGILLHKLPAAFALTATLRSMGYTCRLVVVYLVGFALASPLGYGASAWLQQQHYLDTLYWQVLWAVAGGSLLHIATTLFFEGEEEPTHHLSLGKLGWSVIGAGLACASTLL